MAWRALNDNTLQTAQSTSLRPSNYPNIDLTAATQNKYPAIETAQVLQDFKSRV